MSHNKPYKVMCEELSPVPGPLQMCQGCPPGEHMALVENGCTKPFDGCVASECLAAQIYWNLPWSWTKFVPAQWL